MSAPLPPALHTDLAIHRLSGALITTYDDHLVVRSPDNPHFHWGNCLWVTDPGAVEETDRWLGRFEELLPDARWRSVGLVSPPTGASWQAAGLTLDVCDSLVAHAQPRLSELPDGYRARPLSTDEDWAASIAYRIAERARSGGPHDPDVMPFYRADGATRRRLVEAGHAAWFGAYDDAGAQVGELGIVDCGGAGRYQSVMTALEHRRRGIAGHLIGRAAAWAAASGCTSWVIVAETGSTAGRLYRSFGFEPAAPSATAYLPGDDPTDAADPADATGTTDPADATEA